MNYRIEEKEAFRLIGIKISTTNEKQQCYQDIGELWEKFTSNEEPRSTLMELMDTEPYGMIGANVYNTDSQDAQKFDYYIGCASSKEVPASLESYLVPAKTWAVFPCKMKDVAKTEYNIIKKWAPTSEYEVLNKGYAGGYMEGQAPDLEIYLMGDNAEVWIAVKKK